jgi:hypothetical protein
MNFFDLALSVGSKSMLLIPLFFSFLLCSHLQSPESRFSSRQAEPWLFSHVLNLSAPSSASTLQERKIIATWHMPQSYQAGLRVIGEFIWKGKITADPTQGCALLKQES